MALAEKHLRRSDVTRAVALVSERPSPARRQRRFCPRSALPMRLLRPPGQAATRRPDDRRQARLARQSPARVARGATAPAVLVIRKSSRLHLADRLRRFAQDCRIPQFELGPSPQSEGSDDSMTRPGEGTSGPDLARAGRSKRVESDRIRLHRRSRERCAARWEEELGELGLVGGPVSARSRRSATDAVSRRGFWRFRRVSEGRPDQPRR